MLEILGGGLLYLLGPAAISHLLVLLTQHELSEDPRDWVANHLLHIGPQIEAHRLLAATYLVVNGGIKILLVSAILTKKLWAYPTAIGVLLLFIAYQAYRLTLTFSWFVLTLMCIDAIIALLIGVEYRVRRQSRR